MNARISSRHASHNRLQINQRRAHSLRNSVLPEIPSHIRRTRGREHEVDPYIVPLADKVIGKKVKVAHTRLPSVGSRS